MATCKWKICLMAWISHLEQSTGSREILLPIQLRVENVETYEDLRVEIEVFHFLFQTFHEKQQTYWVEIIFLMTLIRQM